MSSPALPSLRIIFFSTLPAEGVNTVLNVLTQLGQEVPLIVTTPGPRLLPLTTYRDIVAHLRPGQDVLVTSHMRQMRLLLAGLEPDLIFSASFPWRLPPDLLALPRFGCINAHPALLPKYRGPDPQFWVLLNGETQTGVTIHRMDQDFDTGPILAQCVIDIAPDDDADTMFPKYMSACIAMIPDVLRAVAASEPGTPQPTEGASYAPLCTEAERRLDWSRSATQLHNQIRGWASQGALAEVEDCLRLVRRARIVARPIMATPGTVLATGPEGILVQTGAGALLLEDTTPVEN